MHYLDVGGIPVPEAAGLEGVLAGLRELHRRRRPLAGRRRDGVRRAVRAPPGADTHERCRSTRGADAPPRPSRVSFAEAFRFWLKLGFISFGGPAGQIAIMHTELVERRRWISEKRFLHALNYCMLLPGPEAQQLATYIGWLMHRTWGGIVAGALFVLPSLFILIALSWIYLRFGDVPLVAGHLLRAQAGGDRAGAACRAPHRHAGAEEPLDVGHRGGGLRRHLRLRHAVPGHRAGARR